MCGRSNLNGVKIQERSSNGVSLENFDVPDIARYEEDEKGGTFYPGDNARSYQSFGLIVNAWRSLPEPYRAVSKMEDFEARR